MTDTRTAEQKAIWKEYDTHLDFCEQCAMFEQNHPVDPCEVGQAMWSAFYQQLYPGMGDNPPITRKWLPFHIPESGTSNGDITYEMVVAVGAREFRYGKRHEKC